MYIFSDPDVVDTYDTFHDVMLYVIFGSIILDDYSSDPLVFNKEIVQHSMGAKCNLHVDFIVNA